MKRFKFNMEDGCSIDIVARDFASACLVFDKLGEDLRCIDSIEER
jgi:hypothetical protein